MTARSILWLQTAAACVAGSFLLILSVLLPACSSTQSSETPAPAGEEILFQEDFEDTAFAARGWYDNPQIEITSEEKHQGASSCLWYWRRAGDVLPEGKGGRVRVPPGESVTLSYWIKHSPDWTWTGRGAPPPA